ncbi:MAG TPA: flavoprotein [Patescibacteria group bacterium]|nr:flavoprotein [Patescibacteria group bacterium]
MAKEKHIVLGVTASIAIYKACDLVRRFRETGYAVTVVMTREAEELVKPIVFRSLSGNMVYGGLFEEPASWEIGHVSLAEKASAVVVAPATANIIAKISSGICDDLLTCLISATAAPVIICPAMNEGMYVNKITQENIRKLQKLGYAFIAPRKGRLACGKTGIGCLAQIDTIVQEVKKLV